MPGLIMLSGRVGTCRRSYRICQNIRQAGGRQRLPQRALPDWMWIPPRGGLTIWARLPGGMDSGAFAHEALRQGVALVPGRLLSVSDQTISFTRLAFSLPPERLAAATASLAARGAPKIGHRS